MYFDLDKALYSHEFFDETEVFAERFVILLHFRGAVKEGRRVRGKGSCSEKCPPHAWE